jgi:hypothetical protein
MIYQIRVTAFTGKGHVFRDLELTGDMTLEDLHNAIVNAFGLDGMEMASFYILEDDSSLLDEIPLFPMDEKTGTVSMAGVRLDEIFNDKQQRLAYIYDFLNMWQFLVELAGITDAIPGTSYPRLVHSYGELPDSPPDIQFEIDNLNEFPGEEDFLDGEDPFDEFGSNYDDYYYDE